MTEPTLHDIEKSKYERMWAVDAYRDHSPAERVWRGGLKAMGADRGDTVVDLGCGTGRAAVQMLQSAMDVTAVDITESALSEASRAILGSRFQEHNLWALGLNGGSFKYGICVDVMEHIPEVMVDSVISEAARVTTHGVFFQIALFKDGFGKVIGETLHETVKPVGWWFSAMRDHFRTIEAYSADKRHLSIICRE